MDKSDHLMKSLDELIAEDRQKKKWGKDQDHSKSSFQRHAIHKNKYQNKYENQFSSKHQRGGNWHNQRGGNDRFPRKGFVAPQKNAFSHKSGGMSQGGARVKVSNLHYNVTEDELNVSIDKMINIGNFL